MKRQKRTKTAIAVLAALLALVMIQPAFATKVEVNEAKKKVTSLEQEKKKVEATLKSLESLKSDAAAYVKRLDAELDAVGDELDRLKEEIAGKEAAIAQTQLELEEARRVEADQYASMKLRIKYMYERGETSFLDQILQSENLVQMLNRAEYIQQISQYDRGQLDAYEENRHQIETYEIQLKEEHETLLGLKEETEAKQTSVETLLAKKNQELKNFEAQIDKAEDQVSAYERDIKAQEDKVKKLEAEIRRKEEEARKAAEAAGKQYKTTTLGNINFKWPCPDSSRITSSFGSREQPTEGASTNHKGIDIGAPTGTAIVAAAEGTVVISTYSYSAGNYIMLNHGGGVYTVYMHCSKLLVSEGAKVKQGQTIAKVGSTGYSTGPHLHFGIRSNGQYVNPLNYVSP